MKIVIEIPKEFEEHFNSDRFEDSLARVASDIESFGFQLAGRYEQETITMLREALKNSVIIPSGHERLMVLSATKVKENLMKVDFSCQKWISEVGLSFATAAIIEADKESE